MKFTTQVCYTIQAALDTLDLVGLDLAEALDELTAVPDIYAITCPIHTPLGIDLFDGARVRVWHDEDDVVRAVVHG